MYIFIAKFDYTFMQGKPEICSFNQLFTDYKSRFIHFANTYVGDSMIAEDITIDSLMYYWDLLYKQKREK